MTGPIHLYDRYDEPDQLRDQLRRLLRHRGVIALGIVLGLLGGAALTLSRAHTYTSTSEVLVRSTADPFGTVSVAADNQVSMATEQQIAASTAVAVRAARLMGQADGKATALEDGLRITNQAKSQVLRFEFTARTPKRAARGANAFAEAYLADRKARNQAAVQRATRGVEQQIKTVEAAQKKETEDDDATKALQSQLDTLRKRVADINSRDTDGGDVVRRGEAPARPSVPGWPALLALGLAGGLGLGILLAWLRSALDTRVRSADEARAALRTPVLGLLPPGHGEDDDLPAVGRQGGDRAEMLRALAYRLRGTGLPAGTGRLLVVSPRRGAATEEVAVNLAAALAECGDEVLLVDADPGTAALTARLPLLPDDARTPGDAPSLPDGSRLVDAGTAGRFACCAGGSTGSPARTGGAAAVHRLPAGSDSRTTVVVTRPLLEHADALALTQRVDGVVLVAGLGTTRRDDLRRAHELIDGSGGTLLGIVLDAGRRGRLRAVLRRRPAHRPEAETLTPVVELPAQDDTLSVSRG
ncbi:hypothetical protein AQJ11_38750 [Streptomyces corchorusii]|uniref:Lipopolysaccharide biosynthesis protein n=2 Tax=Streptomyces TaxID=1883 RepID=A0A101PT50_STRCK|nr:hypothetical protein [Streptomyces corchorusii]KUN17206.1 hypothetical protein AQJ11_38750 [Streptomyces corchorusii]